MSRPDLSQLRQILERCGVRLPAEQVGLLWRYHQLLRSADAELNLTRIRNFENMVLKHYVDSLLVLRLEELPRPLVDMGSGGGLPGIPLKIARPDVPMILAEPRAARAEFLDRVCDTLGLPAVEVYAGKVGSRFPRTVQGVITRAVASIPETLERVAPVITPGGRMLFMKGPDCDGEIDEARLSHGGSFRLRADHAYEIPGTSHRRRLVVYERVAKVTAALEPSVASEEPTYQVREITSPANPAFKHGRELLHARGIRKHGQALFAGERFVGEILARHPQQAEAWITPSGGPAPPLPGLLWQRLSDALFRELDVFGTRSPLLLVRVPEMREWSVAEPPAPGCTLLVPFQDPENIGAVIRSAAAFGVAAVVLLRESAHPFHPRAARAAGASLFEVSLRGGPSIHDLEPLATQGQLIVLDRDGPDLESEPWPDQFYLLAGLEGPGLPAALRTGPRRSIAMEPCIESLNAATAVAIALHDHRRRRGAGAAGEAGSTT